MKTSNENNKLVSSEHCANCTSYEGGKCVHLSICPRIILDKTMKTPTPFTKEEVEAAQEVRDAVIKEGVKELQAMYISGEIVMWEEMRSYHSQQMSALRDGVIRAIEENKNCYDILEIIDKYNTK